MSTNIFDSYCNIGILGATGIVGQNFLCLLQDHPFFRIKALGASSSSAKHRYSDIVRWKLKNKLSQEILNMTVQECKVENFKECKVIFSALDSSVAGSIEIQFVNAGFAVFSNAKNHRMNEQIPLVVPTCNPEFLKLAKTQKEYSPGFLVANANCSTTGLVVLLKCLQSKFGNIKSVAVQTMQAISGAGYPGCSAIDIMNNVVPYIEDEEEKIETETKKILGKYNLSAKRFESSKLNISAQCNRVAVVDGHMETVMIQFETENKPNIEDIKNTLKCYDLHEEYKTVSFPDAPIIVFEENDRPQPALDCTKNKGYSVFVGRIRRCSVFDVKMVILVHNTILGAAGSSILNAEISQKLGVI